MSTFPVPSVIQCVPKRLDSARQVQQRLGSKLYLDLSGSGGWAFLGSLMTFGGYGHLHLEDDIILAKNFEQLVPPIINKHQDQVIRFFPSAAYSDSKFSYMKPYTRKGIHFVCMLCVWFPNWFPSEFLNWCSKINYPPPDGSENPFHFDQAVGRFLRHTKRSFICWYPSLVQHQVGESVVDKFRRERVSSFFIDELHLWEYRRFKNGRFKAVPQL